MSNGRFVVSTFLEIVCSIYKFKIIFMTLINFDVYNVRNEIEK